MAQPLSEQVAARLREAIHNGQLPLGSRLVERELAEQMGVSRIPVREAIRQLAEEGLVLVEPRRGTFVYRPSISDLEEIASLRVVLERFVVERVLARWCPEHEQRLRRIADAMEAAARVEDRQRIVALDTHFHEALWEIAEHRILSEVVSNLRARISRFLYEATMALPASGLMMHATGHRDLIEVLRSGDVKAAQAFITLHVMGAKDRVLAYCEWPRQYAEQDSPAPGTR